MSLAIKTSIQRGSDFTLAVNEIVKTDCVTALFGTTGSGKTTLLRLVAGLDRLPDTEITFNGFVWQDASTFVPAHQRSIGYVFQHNNLFPHLTVSGNLDFAETRQNNTAITRAEIVAFLEIDPLLNRDASDLSGGEQQRVAIARALLSGPDLLVMDEPLGSMDAAARQRILPYLARLNTQLNIPMIYVSHSLEEVQYLCDHVIALEDGKVSFSGSLIDFSTDLEGQAQPNAAAILRCRVVTHDAAHGLTEVELEGKKMYLAANGYNPNELIQVRIPARDVSVTRQAPGQTSILNVLPVIVEEIVDQTITASVVVKLKCGQQSILARITRKSLADLRLAKGDQVFAQIKGVALMSEHVPSF